MVVTTSKDKGSRAGTSMKPEYRGKEFAIILSDGAFHLIDTSPARNELRDYEDAWIWHMCDEYTKQMTESEGTTAPVGLLSNKEMYKQRCEYCKEKISDGMIGTWKMMNWDHLIEIDAWSKQYNG